MLVRIGDEPLSEGDGRLALYPDGRDDSGLHLAVDVLERSGIRHDSNTLDLLAQGGGLLLANVTFERADEDRVVSLLEGEGVEVVYED